MSRNKSVDEVFTPKEITKIMIESLPKEYISDFSKTFCDPCAGTGNIIIDFIEYRLQYCKTEEDKIKAISTIYGVELMQDNVDECKERIYNLVGRTPEIEEIVNHNIVCSDFFKWDFDNWKPVEDSKSIELF